MCFLLRLYNHVYPNSFGCVLPSPMYRNLTGDIVRTADISLPTSNGTDVYWTVHLVIAEE